MPDRHRHDEFIWALVFSLIINLIFVFALATSRYDKKSPGLQPFIVSIAARDRLLPSQSHAIPDPTAIPAPAKIKRTLEPPPTLRPQNSSDPILPARENDGEATISPVNATEVAKGETALSSLAAAAESTAPAPGQESAAGQSIFGDKISAGHYTAPEYLTGEKPLYPQRAARYGWEGTVLLSLLINANGEVEQVGIAKTSGYELLDQQARKSLRAWRFKPARRNGIAMAVTVQQPIIFCSTPPDKSP